MGIDPANDVVSVGLTKLEAVGVLPGPQRTLKRMIAEDGPQTACERRTPTSAEILSDEPLLETVSGYTDVDELGGPMQEPAPEGGRQRAGPVNEDGI